MKQRECLCVCCSVFAFVSRLSDLCVCLFNFCSVFVFVGFVWFLCLCFGCCLFSHLHEFQSVCVTCTQVSQL